MSLQSTLAPIHMNHDEAKSLLSASAGDMWHMNSVTITNITFTTLASELPHPENNSCLFLLSYTDWIIYQGL